MFDFYFFLTAVPAVMIFGISKGGFAGPIAILAVPLMSMAISPNIAAGILLPILIVMDIDDYFERLHSRIIRLVYDEKRCMLIVINKIDKYKKLYEESVKKKFMI